MDTLKKFKTLIIVGAIALVILIIGGSIFGKVNTLRNEGIARESQLVAQYKDNQQILSTYILQFNETLGIADRQSEKLNNILLDAVKGRYDNDTSLQPGTGGQMFSAITEAYPDLTATSEIYSKVVDQVTSGRNEYKNAQSKLLDLIREYNTWRETGFVESTINDMLGFPGDNLRVTDNGQTYTGQAALDRIERIVLTQEAVESYETGTTGPLITPSE